MLSKQSHSLRHMEWEGHNRVGSGGGRVGSGRGTEGCEWEGRCVDLEWEGHSEGFEQLKVMFYAGAR